MSPLGHRLTRVRHFSGSGRIDRRIGPETGLDFGFCTLHFALILLHRLPRLGSLTSSSSAFLLSRVYKLSPVISPSPFGTLTQHLHIFHVRQAVETNEAVLFISTLRVPLWLLRTLAQTAPAVLSDEGWNF